MPVQTKFTAKELEQLYENLYRFETVYHATRDKTALKRALSTIRGALLHPIFQAKKLEDLSKKKENDNDQKVSHPNLG